MRWIICTALLALNAPFAASADLAVSEATQHDLNRASEIGKAIYLHDLAASRVTDAVMAVLDLEADPAIQGWVTEPVENGIAVTFAGMDEHQRVYGFHRGTVDETGKFVGGVESFEAPLQLNGHLASQFKARQAAIKAGFEPCSESYNTVVLAEEHDGKATWLVYMMPGSSEAGVVPVGGFYRFRIEAESGQILEKRKFTNTCLRMKPPANVAALTLTHLLDPIPTEVHAFIMHSTQKPIYLMTTDNGRMWAVESTGIRLIKDGAKE